MTATALVTLALRVAAVIIAVKAILQLGYFVIQEYFSGLPDGLFAVGGDSVSFLRLYGTHALFSIACAVLLYAVAPRVSEFIVSSTHMPRPDERE